jgi:ferredoxin-NADP reductase
LGVKFYPDPSSYKKKLLSLKPGDSVVASQLAGDFTLPKNKNQKLVFIAGGIGVTPFRSMVKYLMDRQESRPIIFLYSNKTEADILYREVFEEAKEKIGLKTVYALSELSAIPSGWTGVQGMINKEVIKKEIPDYRERTFYISGPRSMIVAFEKTLQRMGIKKTHIKTDYFPGFA